MSNEIVQDECSICGDELLSIEKGKFFFKKEWRCVCSVCWEIPTSEAQVILAAKKLLTEKTKFTVVSTQELKALRQLSKDVNEALRVFEKG